MKKQCSLSTHSITAAFSGEPIAAVKKQTKVFLAAPVFRLAAAQQSDTELLSYIPPLPPSHNAVASEPTVENHLDSKAGI